MSNPKSFPKSLTDKYTIKKGLQPALTDFGSNCGGTKIDLGAETAVELVDAFVKKYPESGYFTLVNSANKAMQSPQKT